MDHLRWGTTGVKRFEVIQVRSVPVSGSGRFTVGGEEVFTTVRTVNVG